MKKLLLGLLAIASLGLGLTGCNSKTPIYNTYNTTYTCYQPTFYINDNGELIMINEDGTETSLGIVKGKDGEDGVSIISVVLTGISGNTYTYTVTLSNGQTYTFTIENNPGSGTNITAPDSLVDLGNGWFGITFDLNVPYQYTIPAMFEQYDVMIDHSYYNYDESVSYYMRGIFTSKDDYIIKTLTFKSDEEMAIPTILNMYDEEKEMTSKNENNTQYVYDNLNEDSGAGKHIRIRMDYKYPKLYHNRLEVVFKWNNN